MESINLTKFHTLFDSNGLDDLTFSEAGIEVKPSSATSNRQMMFAQRAYLEFPCTEQQLYDWAQGLDDHESFYIKLTRHRLIENLSHGYGIYTKRHTFNWSHCVNNRKAVSFHIRPDKHHHFVERLPKDFKEKWKNDNERLKEWGFELGFKPDNIEAAHNWVHWLTRDEWTKEQAARLICDSNPRQVERYEALNMLLDRMPSIKTQTPFNWLKWFDANGFLSCAPKRIREWYVEEKTKSIVDDCSLAECFDTKPDAEPVPEAGAGSQDTEQVSAKAIKPNRNEFEFSGLLHVPPGNDDWFEVIDIMTKAFYLEHKAMPTKAQARTQLWTSPPKDYGVTVDENNCLKISGVIKPFNTRSFGRRWNKYTAKSNPFKPN